MTGSSWEASWGRAVQLCLYKSHSKMINVGTVLYSQAFVQYWTNYHQEFDSCLHHDAVTGANVETKTCDLSFFFFAYMLADTSYGVFVCRPCEWMEPHRREVFMHHHSLSSAVGCWEAVSRSFLVCLLTPTKVSIDEFIPLCFCFFVFFNVGLLILSVSVF